MSHRTFALVSLNLHHSFSSSVIRSIYQKFREVDLLDKKKTVTALQAGEDRAILLGLGMILSSFMMYFVLGITILRYYAESVWTEEGVCVVLNSTVTADMNCSYHCGSDCWRVSKYPCLQVYVSVNNTGRVCRLSHNEETQDASSEVSYRARAKTQRCTEAFQMLTTQSVRLWSVLWNKRKFAKICLQKKRTAVCSV
uniref:Potassium large conductance calcium-activated channel, subfamily M, beta member 2 n=1 Tax=Oryzias latipes TaxID=8090 RepID=A0A3P9M7N5_ORYLA